MGTGVDHSEASEVTAKFLAGHRGMQLPLPEAGASGSRAGRAWLGGKRASNIRPFCAARDPETSRGGVKFSVGNVSGVTQGDPGRCDAEWRGCAQDEDVGDGDTRGQPAGTAAWERGGLLLLPCCGGWHLKGLVQGE